MGFLRSLNDIIYLSTPDTCETLKKMLAVQRKIDTDKPTNMYVCLYVYKLCVHMYNFERKQMLPKC